MRGHKRLGHGVRKLGACPAHCAEVSRGPVVGPHPARAGGWHTSPTTPPPLVTHSMWSAWSAVLLQVLMFLNRLSDYLFTAARFVVSLVSWPRIYMRPGQWHLVMSPRLHTAWRGRAASGFEHHVECATLP